MFLNTTLFLNRTSPPLLEIAPAKFLSSGKLRFDITLTNSVSAQVKLEHKHKQIGKRCKFQKRIDTTMRPQSGVIKGYSEAPVYRNRFLVFKQIKPLQDTCLSCRRLLLSEFG